MKLIQQPIENTKSIKLTITLKDITFSYILNGYVKDNIKENYLTIWNYISMIEDKIKVATIGENKIFYIPATYYWHIYKKMESGKKFLTKYSFESNGMKYIFPTPSMYFDDTFSEINGGRGVYGIYYNDELIYIGYTGRGFYQRWNEHKECFQNFNSSNPMYQECNLNYITFKELITEEDIKNIYILDTPVDKEIFQILEYTLIRFFNPKYNREGIISDYKPTYNNFEEWKEGRDKISTINAIKTWLLSDNNICRNHYIEPEEVWK